MRWQLAGLPDATTGELHRPLPQGAWLLPQKIGLTGGGLAWQMSSPRYRSSGPSLLREFSRLAGATDEEILRFAGRWGVLELCEHYLPATHSWGEAGPPPSKETLCRPRTFEWEGTSWCWEPLDGWRIWAETARAILNTAAALRLNAKPDEEDAEWLHRGHPDFFESVLPQLREMGFIDSSIKAGVWMHLASTVNSWLTLARTRPRIFMEKNYWKIELTSTGLLGAIGIQLLFAVAAGEGFAVCSACGKPYRRTRRPQSGRRNFCPRCGRKAADRLAHQRFREKERLARQELEARRAPVRVQKRNRQR